MDSIYERDAQGNEVGKTGPKKHSLNSLASQEFNFTKVDNVFLLSRHQGHQCQSGSLLGWATGHPWWKVRRLNRALQTHHSCCLRLSLFNAWSASKFQRTAASIGFAQKCLWNLCTLTFAKVSENFASDADRYAAVKSILRTNLQEHNLTLRRPFPPPEYFAFFFDLKWLLKKLQVYGLNTNSLKWFQSYLSGMYQKVCVDGKLSEPLGIHSGVPQGSILGPAFFCSS